jgi:hypothetical protein
MLVRTGALYHHSPPAPQAVVTGRNIAHGHRTVIERAFLAGDVHLGRISPVELTLKQCGGLIGVCTPYVAAAVVIADYPGVRGAVLSGKCSLLDAARQVSAESLAAHIRRSTPGELLEAARDVGVTILWDGMIEPLLA